MGWRNKILLGHSFWLGLKEVPSQKLLRASDSAGFGRIGSDLVRFSRIWLDYCRSDSDSVGIGRIWSDSVRFGPILISGKFGWNRSDLVGFGRSSFWEGTLVANIQKIREIAEVSTCKSFLQWSNSTQADETTQAGKHTKNHPNFKRHSKFIQKYTTKHEIFHQ